MPMHELAKMAIDLYRGSITNYSKEDQLEVFRQELIELNGGSTKITPKSFRKHPEMFEVIETALDILVEEGIQEQFDDFVETVVLDWGDTQVFTIPENRLFDVALVSDGNLDLRRDRLDSGEVTVRTQTYAVALYEEMHRLLAGKVDFPRMVDKVAQSYNNKIRTEIYNAIFDSYDGLAPAYRATGTFTEGTLSTLIAHVEAATGSEAVIMGTKTALSRITNAELADSQRENRSQMGYYGVFYGTDMVEIRQAHRPGTSDFAISNDFLIVTPRGVDPFVKLVLEGDSIISETAEGVRNDMQREYKFIKKAGFAVLASSKYGMYRLT